MTSISKFTSFVDASPTPFHCVAQTVRKLEAAGFTQLLEDASFVSNVVPKGKYYYTRNEGMLVAFAVGGAYKAGGPFKVVGAHTDSPALKVKPKSKQSGNGFLQLGIETYGGGLWHTWLDRDLGIAGRAIVRTGTDAFESKLVNIRKPILRVPSVCIHLQTSSERESLKLNKEEHLTPILGLFDEAINKSSTSKDDHVDERHAPELLQLLAEDIGCNAVDIMDVELTLCDTQPAAIGGVNNEFVFSPRLDNQTHCFTSIEALVDYASTSDFEEDDGCSVVALFDHEEVGSGSTSGAGSPVMRDAVSRISGCFSESQETYKIALQKSLLWSADGSHGVHPNYASKHEKNHTPYLGKGTVIKTNDNQRYATNAVTGFIVREIARRANCQIQEFVVRNDVPCGSTIGPIIAANTGIRTVDIGVPQLSMHSIRETCAVADVLENVKLLHAFFKDSTKIDRMLS